MGFILKMAWRDSRASRRRLLLFSLSITLGIAALVALGSFSASLVEAVRDQAKGLVGADLVITSREGPGPEAQAYIDGLGGEQAKDETFSSMMAFPTDGGSVRLVQVRALEGGFPFYGDFATEPRDAAARFRAAAGAGARPENVVILEATLMTQFHVKAGDPVKLGRATYTVIGGLRKLPGESEALALLAPRALVPLRTLADAGLGKAEALTRHRTTLKLPPGTDPDAVASEMKARFRSNRMSYDTVAERQRQLGDLLTHVYGFLSLVGFVALLLGAIGVASAVHVYIRQKVRTVAVLRCLGASAGQSFGVYLAQGFALGLFGSLFGAVIGVGVQLAMPSVLKGLIPFEVAFSISWLAVARGMAAGFSICVLFTLLPLLAVRRVSPLAALRSSEVPAGSARPDEWRVTIVALIVAAIAGFAAMQTRSIPVGIAFTVALAAGFGVLAGTAWLVARGARLFAASARHARLPYVARQGIANLHRPNNRTVLLLLSLGLGTFIVLSLYLARTTLVAQIEKMDTGRQPNLVFLDLQDDQVDAFDRLLADRKVPIALQAPLVSMRIASVKGQPVGSLLADRRGRGSSWTLRREYRATYRTHLDDGETIVAGGFTGRVPEGKSPVPVSIEDSLAKELQLEVGDAIDWDVQGLPVRAVVGSIRHAEVQRLGRNFPVVFPAGVLEGAPKFYVAALRASSPAASADIQRAVIKEFPNLSAIDLSLVLQTFDGIFSKVSFVIEFMALFTVATGVVVLAGAVVSGRYHRLREMVLLQTLGATRSQVSRIQFVEHAVLGFLSALVGVLLAVGGGALLAREVFHLPASAPIPVLLGAVAAVMAVTLAAGWLADRGAGSRSPMEVLRQESQ